MARRTDLKLDLPEVGGEYIPSESEAAAQSVEDFVESQIGLDVLQSFGRKSAGRRRSKPPLYYEYTRDLTVDDALIMQAAPARQVGEAGGTPALQRIRTIHHQIARMLADGTKIVNISAILGVTPARVQQLKNDPAFAELLAHYEACEEQAQIDMKHRFYLLGSAGMEELQDRLLHEPDSFGNGHLMELVKLTVGGEAPRTSTQPSRVGGMDKEALSRLKQQADSNGRARITYRNQTAAEENSSGKTETD